MAYWVDFKTDDPFTTTFAYTTANELTKMTENGVDTTFTYNDWGRTVSKQKTVGQTTYTATYGYLYGDKLKSVASDFPGESGEVAYNYDGLGKRRNKVVNDTDVTWYRWDADWGMIAEYAGQSGSWTVGTREMSYLEGMVQVPGDDPSSGTYAVFGKDHLGSTRSLFNGSKAETARLEYMPYGEERIAAGDVPAKRYTGHTWDAETGFYYTPYRYYSPHYASWLTRDPLGMVDGPNLKAYVRGNPVVLSDRLGLACGSGWTDWIVPDVYGDFDFIDACERHDACYGCDGATKQLNKDYCDYDFLSDMLASCDDAWLLNLALCKVAAYTYYLAVEELGDSAFESARRDCSGCGGSSPSGSPIWPLPTSADYYIPGGGW